MYVYSYFSFFQNYIWYRNGIGDGDLDYIENYEEKLLLLTTFNCITS